jgi:hypothetical protein
MESWHAIEIRAGITVFTGMWFAHWPPELVHLPQTFSCSMISP